MNKSICFIAGGLSGGGQERALTYLANEFALRGNKISIICLFKTEIFFDVITRYNQIRTTQTNFVPGITYRTERICSNVSICPANILINRILSCQPEENADFIWRFHFVTIPKY